MIRPHAAMLLAGAIATSAWGQAPPEREPRQAELDARAEMVGKVLNYEYADAAELRVLIHDDGISWEGVSGNLRGMRSRSSGLRLTRVDEDIYFATWVTATGGEDSIVFNLNDMTVFAHVLDGRQGNTFQLDGVIRCFGDENTCVAPDTTPMSSEERRAIFNRNAQQTQGQ